MTLTKIRQHLRAFRELSVAVVGDFFLDAYFDCDREIEETSLETGKRCYQVVNTRRQAGAAGTVAANLVSLGVGTVEAVGYCGDDGEGYELRRAMTKLGLQMNGFFTEEKRFTPTYGKPCYIQSGRVVEELERIDIKNRRPTPKTLQERIIRYIGSHCQRWDGVIIVDQANEQNCGVITTRVRRYLLGLAQERKKTVFMADSRERIGLYKNVIIKPNQAEAAIALGSAQPRSRRGLATSKNQACQLVENTQCPVFLTLSERGMLLATKEGVEHVQGFPVSGLIDPVGAGDSTSAAIVATLSAGAGHLEAATIANLVGSITVQQIGTTGTASPAQIIRRYRETILDAA